ncbi:hypothetical protein DPMN_144778 [Dreissena polymorpha]|uniref:Uncharacterized protein n=1 Tax=Dreissena polymorpha TaxID=45954 RepID=A0A9D4F7F8_DREPO|nr:hypothetical protein DPMN_144778 [Dreissena polymorpha]
MQVALLSQKADDVQDYYKKRDYTKVYNALKDVYSRTSSGSTPLLSSKGTLSLQIKRKSRKGG